MQKFIVAASMLLLFVGCLFFVTDMVIGDTTHTDNKSSLERGGEIAVAKSVKVGTLRAEEEITIDPEKRNGSLKKHITVMRILKILLQNVILLSMMYRRNQQ